MNKQVLILGTALTVSLVASYLSWTAEEGTDADDSIVMLDADVGDLESISWDGEKLDVEVIAKSDPRGDYWWVTTTETRRVPSKKSHTEPDEALDDPEAEETPAEELEEYEDTVKVFKAGKAATDLAESLAPLEAARVLADVGEDRYEDFGLVEPDATLVVVRKGKDPRTFKVGGEAYGTRDRYVLSDDGKVYLVDQDLLRPLKYGTTRLPDRDLHDDESKDLTNVTLTTVCPDELDSDCVDATVELTQHNAQDAANAYWAVGDGEESETAQAWLDKALALKSSGYVQKGDEPTELTLRLQLLVATGDQTTTIEIQSGLDADGKEGWYARSEHTRELVKLHKTQASEVVEDVESVVEL
ncbi:MAG: DUF4340 domain-containing protein [Proteobacteria bacterium]|nr:DUF4340 domain-containing protein [Pseudomonadota bacterium]MCP4920556.1 DUF4340 domain-containing protein [Pseudomonadota bacterium]